MRGVEICISPAVSRKPHSARVLIERRRRKSNREVELERLLHLLPGEARRGGWRDDPRIRA